MRLNNVKKSKQNFRKNVALSILSVTTFPMALVSAFNEDATTVTAMAASAIPSIATVGSSLASAGAGLFRMASSLVPAQQSEAGHSQGAAQSESPGWAGSWFSRK